MNFDQAKALRLQQWRSTLDNQEFRMQSPEAHRQTLHSMSDTLAAEGLIDKLEQFDMNEMANAAYWHAVEELHNSLPRYCGASSYDVVIRGTAELFGRISRSIFHDASSLADPQQSGYDGKIYPDASGANLIFNASGATARITGLTMTLPDGGLCDLIETRRVVEGVTYEPIDDPDIYRALVDTAQLAQESHDLRAFEKARPLLDLASFCTCPACLDRFGARDDCPACSGKGFVTKPKVSGLR
ncbi:hypothetical protein [Pseudomonas arsenicoxydans]|uniref:Uncharacterized protein n=1 Tax=Pseudomonas arsenicoxydans TaxID=702115 RepID=A0A4V0YKV0_9PSED|nr:hypothetical protein [Pseudomonas arsenicoxydans]QAY88414.1 hypothetical protein CUN61_26070 [Pseudomonas arsenicoxydans]